MRREGTEGTEGSKQGSPDFNLKWTKLEATCRDTRRLVWALSTGSSESVKRQSVSQFSFGKLLPKSSSWRPPTTFPPFALPLSRVVSSSLSRSEVSAAMCEIVTFTRIFFSCSLSTQKPTWLCLFCLDILCPRLSLSLCFHFYVCATKVSRRSSRRRRTPAILMLGECHVLRLEDTEKSYWFSFYANPHSDTIKQKERGRVRGGSEHDRHILISSSR